MLSVTLLCVGRLRERYFTEAVEEYRKRLGAFCRFTLEELPEQRLGDNPSPKEIAAALEREAEAITRRIPAGALTVAFCVEGDMLDSGEFAARLRNWAGGGRSSLCFLIGGSFGLSEELKRSAALRLSLSPMTFPHHLFRVMAVEQLYRAFTINSGMKYHK
ncbi:MAG: 23S rRNA (pseudouridine(1915)-N(3))-methyltransferase RlmH [Oscillospiraceae bacterium]|nr:23S rRNA (pseudouridine(1915)-N(3))-methyltransferase RlmH [Oscillospiraceae bacterium]